MMWKLERKMDAKDMRVKWPEELCGNEFKGLHSSYHTLQVIIPTADTSHTR